MRNSFKPIKSNAAKRRAWEQFKIVVDDLERGETVYFDGAVDAAPLVAALKQLGMETEIGAYSERPDQVPVFDDDGNFKSFSTEMKEVSGIYIKKVANDEQGKDTEDRGS